MWRTAPTHARRVHAGGSYFDWIAATNDPRFAKIRDRIERLWIRLPDHHRGEYAARLRSKRCTDFFSAYSELWYRDALESGGLRCSPPDPTGSGTVPDWQIGSASNPIAIAECLVRLPPEKVLRDDLMQRRWFDQTFSHLTNRGIRVWIHKLVCGRGTPSARAFARHLDELATNSKIDEDHGTFVTRGRHVCKDRPAGWSVDFTLVERTDRGAELPAQLLFFDESQHAEFCRGADRLKRALERKSRQHTTELPVVICIAWNEFEHEPGLDEVQRLVASIAGRLERRGVFGVFWAPGVYPWSVASAAPLLLDWGSDRIETLRSCWTGKSVHVRPSPAE